MDNIVISIKDADYISKIIRRRLEDLNNSYKEALEEGERRYKLASDITNKLFPENQELQESLQELSTAKIAAKEAMDRKYEESRQEYTFILEIMMAGSSNQIRL